MDLLVRVCVRGRGGGGGEGRREGPGGGGGQHCIGLMSSITTVTEKCMC